MWPDCLVLGEYQSWTERGVVYLLSCVGVWAHHSAGGDSTRLWDIEEEWRNVIRM
jgi:hypothetical protein